MSQQSPPPATTDARARRRPIGSRVAIGAVLVALGIVAAVAFYAVRTGEPRLSLRVTVESDPDRAAPGLAAAMRYVTTVPATSLPAPPGGRDTCTSRYGWAHAAAVSAVDAPVTVARIDLTVSGTPTALEGATVVYGIRTDPVAGTLLSCPAAAEAPPTPVDPSLAAVVRVDLDSGAVAGASGVAIPVGQTVHLLVFATATSIRCQWRLELHVRDGGELIPVTIGPGAALLGAAAAHPDQAPFDTSGTGRASVVRYRDGQWTPVPPLG